jgi:hypothetical protein
MLKYLGSGANGEPYKVTQFTSVYGCCMGLRSDILGCRYCLCGPCKDNREEADSEQRPKRGDKAMKDKLKDKTVECGSIPERHLRINLVREDKGNYFRQGAGEREKNCPRMCCGCLRPFVG